MEALEKGSVYTAVIDGYSSEGLGIARVNGAVVFVPHAVRGEEIDLRITKVMKTSCAGEIVKIHNPSPERMPGSAAAAPTVTSPIRRSCGPSASGCRTL